MRYWFAKAKDGWIPTDEDGERLLKRMGMGECAEFTVIRPRSLPQHRRFFGICRSIGQNQAPKRDEKSICNELKVLAGHYDVLPIHGAEGYEVRIPKSIAFENLTRDEWAELLPSLELAIAERFGDTYLTEQL